MNKLLKFNTDFKSVSIRRKGSKFYLCVNVAGYDKEHAILNYLFHK